MRKIIENIVQKDINQTPYYRLIYRLVETDPYLKKVCDFICDIAEGKFSKFIRDDYVMCFENLFYFTQVIFEDKYLGHNQLSLAKLSDFLWKLAQGEMTFVYGHIFENKYHYCSIKTLHPDYLRTFKFSFMVLIREDGTKNPDVDKKAKSVSVKDICIFIDNLVNYAKLYENSEVVMAEQTWHKQVYEKYLFPKTVKA